MADSVDDVQNKVRQWIQEEGWDLEARRGKGIRWLCVVKAGDKVINLAQQSTSQDRIDISARFVLSSDSPFLYLPKSARDSVVFNIGLALTVMNLEWGGMTGDPGEVVISSPIYYDGLTKNSLVKEMIKVAHGAELAVNGIKRATVTALLEDNSVPN